ncbi:PEP-CTERM sorting domain-containing protein [Rubripirellula tenax]|nr:PEP-CTERM sorting domain-containing protein [Rubripirellula tenax]
MALFATNAQADILLMDMFAGVDPTTTAGWTSAGFSEDLTNAAAFNYNGAIFNISGGLTMSTTGAYGGFLGSNYPGNDMLNGYAFTFETIAVSVGGFETGGVANTLTTSGTFAGVGGNTFTLQANQKYELYLFGSGDNNDQNTTFVFDGVSKSTSPTILGTADNAGHFVTYDFTTGSDLSGFTLDFTFGPEGSSNGAFNGFALASVTAVPEPSSLALVACTGLAGVIFRRRRRSEGRCKAV